MFSFSITSNSENDYHSATIVNAATGNAYTVSSKLYNSISFKRSFATWLSDHLELDDEEAVLISKLLDTWVDFIIDNKHGVCVQNTSHTLQ